ncbi:hypothetical protein PENARI_c025G09840 [Penicillium arizonense]|uniref:Uncharacterized protein n=1 Tax=Penicillium arizonense TaxID=1835702 RepID=A0A1F5L6L5_PENAI|nr:hypothetical protein PENARI_c025G09840 [Penicillium arizonense]OGE48878.1 hypothetical protein PENARI_c025G09840 [Penicillium arizonense]
MSTLTNIASEADLSSHLATLSDSTLLILHFYTPWTEFCANINALLSTFALQYPATTPPTLSFVSINAKTLVDVSRKFGVPTAPRIIVLRNGQQLQSIKYFDSTLLRKALDRFAGVSPDAATAAPDTPALSAKQLNEILVTRLTELTRAAPVMLFMKGTPMAPQCRFSRRLVSLLCEHGIDYEHFDVLANEEVRQGLKDFGSWPTFPQLWVQGKLIGGLDIIRDEFNSNPDFLIQYSINSNVDKSL